jgi:hypothetical protein
VMPAITSDLGNPLPRLLPSHAHAFQGFFSPRRNALETERRFCSLHSVPCTYFHDVAS